ncbi:MAG: 23S rRNA (adenine(2503)-C(2))-methyltransferase RlmN, partial [Alphaproteobacteria bacterium]
ADILNAAGYASPIRRPRGRDILAACGQLKTESERKRKVGAFSSQAESLGDSENATKRHPE